VVETRVSTAPTPEDKHRFAIALSFPGERRDYVKQVADSLAGVFGSGRVLYDKYHEAEFARVNLDVHLPALYRTRSELIVVFLCPEYARKPWCGLELRHIRQLIPTPDASRIMLVSFGDPGDLSEIGILRGDGHLDIGARPAVEIAGKIIERFRLNGGVTPPAKGSPGAKSEDERPVDVSRIDRYAPENLIGREVELASLDDAWERTRRAEAGRPRVLTLVALGGEGKTSLVARWAAKLAAADWPDCEAAFAWSFYSQGTREQMTASSDLFLKEALTFFGDPETAGSARSALDKGRRLAELVGAQRALLVLDGLEPLQHAPTSPQAGELKDQGVSALLKALAARSRGLCVVTTRYSVPDLRSFRETTAPETKLVRLSKEAGVVLLGSLHVRGTKAELEKLVDDVMGHALTLNLLGTYLHEAHGGDVRRRDRVKLGEASDEQGGHAFHVMDAYVKWLAAEGEKGRRAIAMLSLLGLFDRPATADCLAALKQFPAIPDLTESLAAATEEQVAIAQTRLETARLLTVNRDTAGALVSLDAHPLLREYFALKLRNEQPEAWRTAHRRLCEHLCATTEDKPEPTLEDLQPLYQAVAHGCQAGLQGESFKTIYYDRILRGTGSSGFYTMRKLGAFGVDLGAVACFFDQPWSRVSPALAESVQAWLLSEAGYHLRALGRLTEALEPMRAVLARDLREQEWENAAVSASNLSGLEIALGDIAAAARDADASVTYADRSSDLFHRLSKRAALADAQHQAGRRVEAETTFLEADAMQAERQPHYPLLYSMQGFLYCDLLLAAAERACWSRHGVPLTSGRSGDSAGAKDYAPPSDVSAALRSCRNVSNRTAKIFDWGLLDQPLLDIALDHLSLGRAALCASILESSSEHVQTAASHIAAAVNGVRRAGAQHHIPRALLTRAWLRSLTRAFTGPDSAQSDLDEAWEIAERGPMRLFLADIHLYRARLFRDVTPYPWSSPRNDLAEARELIEKCGYWRRKEELEDAEAALS
jgi:hypothetical protein